MLNMFMFDGRPRHIWAAGLAMLFSSLVGGCAHDFYEQRVDMIEEHNKAFADHVKKDRVEAAIHENEEIEAIASEMADAIRKREAAPDAKEKDREWIVLKKGIETAVENWLKLGQHLAKTKKYDQARAAYQRVMDTYTGETERPYRERAARAQRDIDILNPRASASPPSL